MSKNPFYEKMYKTEQVVSYGTTCSVLYIEGSNKNGSNIAKTTLKQLKIRI
jgi:hypothetical protein